MHSEQEKKLRIWISEENVGEIQAAMRTPAARDSLSYWAGLTNALDAINKRRVRRAQRVAVIALAVSLLSLTLQVYEAWAAAG